MGFDSPSLRHFDVDFGLKRCKVTRMKTMFQNTTAKEDRILHKAEGFGGLMDEVFEIIQRLDSELTEKHMTIGVLIEEKESLRRELESDAHS